MYWFKRFRHSTRVFLYFLGGILCMLMIFQYLYRYPLVDTSSLKIYDRQDILLADIRNPHRKNIFLSLKEVPAFLLSWIIFREDKNFWNHYGIDFKALLRASWRNVQTRSLSQGASTIDQQVVKLSQSAFSRTWTQKIQETRRAVNINLHYSKQEILLYYLNNTEFSKGIKGFSTACQIYFNSPCSNLNNLQLTYLITKSKYPSRSSLSKYSFDSATYLWLTGFAIQDFITIEKSLWRYVESKAPYFTSYLLTTSEFLSGNIKSTFDYQLYQKIQSQLDLFKPYLHSQKANDACILVMSGQELISMNLLQEYGSKGSFLNGCLRPRQVGSALKPFIYLLAFHLKGYHSETTIEDKPVDYFLENGGIYAPKNFDMTYHGKVSVGQALGSSLNIPAVKILHELGLTATYSFLSTIGHQVNTSELRQDDVNQYGLALALGVKELSPLDFTKMWTIFQDQASERMSWLKSYDTSILEIKKILSSNMDRLLSFPQINRFDLPDTYVKSGTSRNFVDGRVCGGKWAYTVCVRVGNYNAAPTKDSGYHTAGVLRNAVMKNL